MIMFISEVDDHELLIQSCHLRLAIAQYCVILLE